MVPPFSMEPPFQVPAKTPDSVTQPLEEPKFKIFKSNKGPKNSINPGPLVLEDRYRYHLSRASGEEGDRKYFYNCMKMNKTGCKANAHILDGIGEGEQKYLLSRWQLKGCTLETSHNHPADESMEITRQMKKDIVNLQDENPQMKPEECIRAVKIKYEELYKNKLDMWDDIIADFGEKTSIQRNVRKHRHKATGKRVLNRDDFNYQEFLDIVPGGRKVITIDSNNPDHLPHNWNEKLEAFKKTKEDDSDKTTTEIYDNACSDNENEVEKEINKNDDNTEGVLNCEACKGSTQHFCRRNGCRIPLCQTGCSIQDPDSDNEMHRVHKIGDIRCGESDKNKTKEAINTEKYAKKENPKDKKMDKETNDDSSKDKFKQPPKTIVIFTTWILLMLVRFGKWSMDGTFKAAPVLWGQIVIVMAKVGPLWIPVSYALMPDKEKENYFLLSMMMRKYVEDNLKVKFAVTKVILDFEIAIAQAVDKVWGAAVQGCLFHFSQAVWRFCQANGMAVCFAQCQEFRDFVKMVLALSHVPLKDLQQTMDKLKNLHIHIFLGRRR